MYAFLTGALLAVVVGLAGCAAPRYQTLTRLEAPADAAARPCVERCEATLTACQRQCRARREACVKALDAEVEEKYAEALRHYAAALDAYRLELERQRLEYWMSWGRGRWWYDPWPYYPVALALPAAPSREAVRERLAKTRCDQDCGCGTGHEACFVACGGRRVEERRCVANCPPQ